MTDAERNELVEKAAKHLSESKPRTVFGVLHGSDDLQQETVERMVSAIESLGYEIVKKEPGVTLTQEDAEAEFKRLTGL